MDIFSCSRGNLRAPAGTILQVLIVTSFTFANGNPANCTGLQEGHGCKCNDTSGKLTVSCVNTNLESVPDDLTDPYSMLFTGNKFQVLNKLDYGNLVYLDVHDNGIRYIMENAFSELSHVLRLDLSKNNIAGLHNGTFAGLKSLKILDLSHNPLQAIPYGTFPGSDLPSIQTLSMKFCHLHFIDDGTFDTLSTLLQLNIMGNELMRIPKFGGGLSKVETLDLSHNIITKLSDNTFMDMKSLKYLQLSYNQYISITQNTFAGTEKSLINLHMRGNYLSIINNHAFENLTTLETLDLTYNMISQMDGERIPWNSIQKILLHDNPWECSCINSWLTQQPLVKQYNKNLNGTNMRCARPLQLNGTDVFTLEKTALQPCGTAPHHLWKPAGIVIGIVMLAAIVVIVILVRRRLKKKRDDAIRSNSVYSRMEDDAFEI